MKKLLDILGERGIPSHHSLTDTVALPPAATPTGFSAAATSIAQVAPYLTPHPWPAAATQHLHLKSRNADLFLLESTQAFAIVDHAPELSLCEQQESAVLFRLPAQAWLCVEVAGDLFQIEREDASIRRTSHLSLPPTLEPWLTELLTPDFYNPSLFRQARAWGNFLNLNLLPGPEARAFVAAVLAGHNPPLPGAAAERWIAAVSDADRREILAHALINVDALSREINNIDADDAELPGWHQRVRNAFHARDDLAGLAALLGHVGAEERLLSALALIDHDATHWIDRLPSIDGLHHDLRLSRARIVNPDAWWTANLE